VYCIWIFSNKLDLNLHFTIVHIMLMGVSTPIDCKNSGAIIRFKIGHAIGIYFIFPWSSVIWLYFMTLNINFSLKSKNIHSDYPYINFGFQLYILILQTGSDAITAGPDLVVEDKHMDAWEFFKNILSLNNRLKYKSHLRKIAFRL